MRASRSSIFLTSGLVAGSHVGARQWEQAVELVTGVAHEPADALSSQPCGSYWIGRICKRINFGHGVDDLAWISQVPKRGPGHAGTDLLVTNEGGFPIAQFVDRRFPDVVQERRKPRNQIGGASDAASSAWP